MQAIAQAVEQQAARQAATEAEASLLMQAENAYLKQRTVALNMQVRTLTAEVDRLKALVPPEPKHRAEDNSDPEPGSE